MSELQPKRLIEYDIKSGQMASGVIYCGACLKPVSARITYGIGSEDEPKITQDDLLFLHNQAQVHIDNNPTHWVRVVLFHRT